MSNKNINPSELFDKRVKKGDKDAIELMEYATLYECLIDLFEATNEMYLSALQKNGFVEKMPREVNFFMKASKELSAYQKKYVGAGQEAETFANKFEPLQNLFLKVVLMPNEAIEAVIEFANSIEIEVV